MEASAADHSGCRRRFTVACDVFSRQVRAEAEAAAWMTAGPAQPHFPAAPASPTMLLLMPGADITPHVEEKPVEAAPAPSSAQLTICYGGRVLVFDNVQPHKAAEIMSAARRDAPPAVAGLADTAVARKRQERLAAKAPYSTPGLESSSPLASSRQGKVKDAEDGWWLGLGIPGTYGR